MNTRAAYTVICVVFLNACATPETLLPAKAAYRPEPVRVVQISDWSEIDGLRLSFVLCGPGVCPSATPKTRIDSLSAVATPLPLPAASVPPPPEFSQEALESYLGAAVTLQSKGAEASDSLASHSASGMDEPGELQAVATTAGADERSYQVRFVNSSTRMSPAAIQSLYAWIQHFEDVPIRYELHITGPIRQATADRRLQSVWQALRSYGVPVFRLRSASRLTAAADPVHDGKSVTVTVTAFAGFVTESEQPVPAAFGNRGTLADERAADTDTSTPSARSFQSPTLLQE